MEKVNFKIEVETSEMKKYREDAISSILNDEIFFNLLKEDGFNIDEIKENVGKFDRYHRSYLKNIELKKYEDCKKENDFFMYYLKKDENGFMVELNREYDAFHRFMSYSSRFIYKDFDIDNLYNLKFNDILRENLKSDIKKCVSENIHNFYIYGSHSTYKTISAIALSNYFVKRIKNDEDRIAFINVPKRFSELKDLVFGYDKDIFQNNIEMFSNVKYLVLDSLGEEYRNEITRDLILLPILRNRAKNKELYTFITTPYEPKDFKKIYTFKDNNPLAADQIIEFLVLMKFKKIFSGKLEL